MNKINQLVIVLLIIAPQFLCCGQSKITECKKFIEIASYLKKDTSFVNYYQEVKINFKINNIIGHGGILPFMTYDYIAGILNVTKEEVFHQDTSIIYSLVREIEKDELRDTSTAPFNCLHIFENEGEPTIYLSFNRKNNNVITLYSERIHKKPEHSRGMIYLFFFDDNNKIDKVFHSRWVE